MNPLAAKLLAATVKNASIARRPPSTPSSSSSTTAPQSSSVPRPPPKRGERPIGAIMREVLQKLDPHTPLSTATIQQTVRMSPSQWPELVKQLADNPLVIVDDGRYTLKAKHVLHNRQEMLALVERTYEGVLVAELKDTYKTANADLEELIAERRVLRMLDEQKQAVVYPNVGGYPVAVSHEVKQLWSAVRIPDDVDLERELAQAQLSTATSKPRQKRPAKKKAAGPAKVRKVKLTNDHILGVDLNQDYVRPAPPP